MYVGSREPKGGRGATNDRKSRESRRAASLVGEALAHSVGFRVAAGGAVLGTVDEVRYGPSTRWDHPTSLALRSGNRSVLVAANAVKEVLPSKRLVVLADPVVITASEAWDAALPHEVEAHARRSRRRRRKPV